MDIRSRLDAWIIGFALRCLGITTVCVPSLAGVEWLKLRNVRCVLTTEANPGPSPIPHIHVPHDMYLNIADDDVAECPAMPRPAGGHILVTSGSTGIKKKVLIDDASLTQLIPRHIDFHSFSARSVYNLFDFELWTGMGYKMPPCVWSLGGAVVFHQGKDRHRSLLIEGITHAFVTPSVLAALLQAPVDEICRNDAMRLIVGSAPMSRALLSATKDRLTSQIFAAIGSTEIGNWALTPIEGPDDLGSHIVHPSVEVQVVDEVDRPLPAGRIGAIRIRMTDGITGYVDDEDATRTFFRHGYFYTGDLGAFEPSGRLVLHGRDTNIINYLGEKFSAESVEQAIENKLSAGGACVLSIETGEAEAELHVVIQLRGPVAKSDLDAAITSELPRGSVVTVHFIDTLPRNDTGKIDRAALRQIVTAALARGSVHHV